MYQSREKLRVDGYWDFVHLLTLPAGADAELAADILITLHSPRLYLALREGRGWPHEKVIEWMARTIPQLVVGAT